MTDTITERLKAIRELLDEAKAQLCKEAAKCVRGDDMPSEYADDNSWPKTTPLSAKKAELKKLKLANSVHHKTGLAIKDQYDLLSKVSAELIAIQSTISSAESDAGKLAEAVLARYVATMPYEEAIKDCAKPITAALLKAASVKAQDETGWLIELAASPPSEPKYWQNGSLWTGDNIKAIRFARKEDAERIAALMLDGMNIRICEHIWTA